MLFAPSGTRFATNALARIADAFDKIEDADIVYGDVDIIAQEAADGRSPFRRLIMKECSSKAMARICLRCA